MSDQYWQIDIRTVLAVRNREACIRRDRDKPMYKHITGIVQNKYWKTDDRGETCGFAFSEKLQIGESEV